MVIDDYSRLPAAPDQHRVTAPEPGTLCEMDAELVGRAAVALGAGRATLDDVVDHGVGITVLVPPGKSVARGEPIFLVRHRGGRGLDDALALLEEAVHIGGEPCPQAAGPDGEVDSTSIAAGGADRVSVLCVTRQAPQPRVVATSRDHGLRFAVLNPTPGDGAGLLAGGDEVE